MSLVSNLMFAFFQIEQFMCVFFPDYVDKCILYIGRNKTLLRGYVTGPEMADDFCDTWCVFNLEYFICVLCLF